MGNDTEFLCPRDSGVVLPSPFTHHFLAEVVPPLLGDVDRRLAVVVLDAGVGARAEQQPHALALVLDDAVVEGGVALARLLVQVRRVLHQEVDDVQRVAIVLPGNGVVETSFGELLERKSAAFQSQRPQHLSGHSWPNWGWSFGEKNVPFW